MGEFMALKQPLLAIGEPTGNPNPDSAAAAFSQEVDGGCEYQGANGPVESAVLLRGGIAIETIQAFGSSPSFEIGKGWVNIGDRRLTGLHIVSRVNGDGIPDLIIGARYISVIVAGANWKWLRILASD